jgi:hypothetical protein
MLGWSDCNFQAPEIMGSRRARSSNQASGRPGTSSGVARDKEFAVALAAHRRGDLATARDAHTRILERRPQNAMRCICSASSPSIWASPTSRRR